MMNILRITVLIISIQNIHLSQKSTFPNIIFIVADDLGWNDVGFHGSGEIPTPNIDSLAYSGVILNNYYTNPICTPSRSALMTGKYPIHTGMQHGVIYGAETRGLPLSEKILPEYLKDLGYMNHIIGKWHLGSYKKEYLPLSRGFDSHLGYWTGHQDYFDHSAMENSAWGLDMRRNMEVAYDLHGQCSTDVFTSESVRIIANHNTTKPLFLYLAHAAVHSGNPYNFLPAKDKVVKQFRYINEYYRERFAAMLTGIDNSIGQIVKALKENNILQNSIIIFTTDNGGPAAGFNNNAASNYPLRGVKNTLWEGGVRGAALIWSPLIKAPKRVSKQMMHICDWLPTLINAIGGNVSFPRDLDGINIWNELSQDGASKREEVLHNIDDLPKYGAHAALTVKNWKLVKGTTYNGQWDGWYGPSGREYFYNITDVTLSNTGIILSSINMSATTEEIEKLRDEATIRCWSQLKSNKVCDAITKPCLFNIAQDPCELNNVADEYPHITNALLNKLETYNQTVIPPNNTPIDPRGDPKYWNYVWTNFGDYLCPNVTCNYILTNKVILL